MRTGQKAPPDPALEIAARVLPDPKALTAAERGALGLALRLRLVECRGGFRAGDERVSRATARSLESRHLASRVLERGRYALICTGAGKALLDIINQSATDRSKP